MIPVSVTGIEAEDKLREEPFVVTLTDVRTRLLMLLEIRPGVDFTASVLTACRSRRAIEPEQASKK
jgi:hypothetical protein